MWKSSTHDRTVTITNFFCFAECFVATHSHVHIM